MFLVVGVLYMCLGSFEYILGDRIFVLLFLMRFLVFWRVCGGMFGILLLTLDLYH